MRTVRDISCLNIGGILTNRVLWCVSAWPGVIISNYLTTSYLWNSASHTLYNFANITLIPNKYELERTGVDIEKVGVYHKMSLQLTSESYAF